MKVLLTSLFFINVALLATPPKTIPAELFDAYTDEGKTAVVYHYLDDSVPTKGVKHYAKSRVNELIKRAKKKKRNYYGRTDKWLYALLDRHKGLVKGKTVAVIGSADPWYEAVVLSYKGHPFTIEYNRLETDDPRLTLVTVEEFKKNPRKFDLIISISSFEHDGLGRYGDPLDPDGDLRAMQECLSMLNPGGKLILSVPIGGGCLVWNAHRIYGRERLPKFLKGWKMVDYSGKPIEELLDGPQEDQYKQPILLLEPA